MGFLFANRSSSLFPTWITTCFVIFSVLVTPARSFAMVKQMPTTTAKRSKLIRRFGASADESTRSGYNDGGPVRVRVEQFFPGVTPTEAREAWISYHWERGANLPGVVVLMSKQNKGTRRLAPIWMEETLLDTPTDEDDTIGGHVDSSLPKLDQHMLHYKVTDMGLLSSELQDASHSSTVRFVSIDNNTISENISTTGTTTTTTSTTMIWEVAFEAYHRRELWQIVTEGNIQTATSNLASYLAPPCLYRHTTIIPLPPVTSLENSGDDKDDDTLAPSLNVVIRVDVDDIMKKWMEFVWYKGGGLPIPPFALVQLNNTTRMYIPPFLKERIQSISSAPQEEDDKESSHKLQRSGEIRYTVDNLGLFTYQAHTHVGRVQFESHPPQGMDNGATDTPNQVAVKMLWEVEVRPMRGWEWFLKSFTSAIISTLARNFKVHLAEPNAIVSVDLGQTQINVRKDTWLGGVLATRLENGSIDDNNDRTEGEDWTTGHLTENV